MTTYRYYLRSEGNKILHRGEITAPAIMQVYELIRHMFGEGWDIELRWGERWPSEGR
jgi:hypothetical protein